MQRPAILAVVEQDLRLIRRIRELAGDYGFDLHITRSAQEAILYLRGVGVYSDRLLYPLPFLVLLDTGNGGASDLEVLAWIRQDSRFIKLPVVLLASEPPHKVRVACAVDTRCFAVDRDTLWEVPAVSWGVLFGGGASSGARIAKARN